MIQRNIIALFLFFFSITVFSQQYSVPYINYFEGDNAEEGWSHYAIEGNDDWELGIPNNDVFDYAYSGLNAWVTDLDSAFSQSSNSVLVSPYFDLSNDTADYVLSFVQKREGSAGGDFYLEYSVGSDEEWLILNDADAQKKNWQSNYGFYGDYIGYFQFSSIDLSFIQGSDSIRFRFNVDIGNSFGDEGWLIDDFRIEEEYQNFVGRKGDTTYISSNCYDINANVRIGYHDPYLSHVLVECDYYFSYDSLFDISDSLLKHVNLGISSHANFTTDIVIPDSIEEGNYYVFYVLDENNLIEEINEDDNVGYSIINVSRVHETPYLNDFEGDGAEWITSPKNLEVKAWKKGNGYSHHLEGTHSGLNAWHTSGIWAVDLWPCFGCYYQYLETPYLDLTTQQSEEIVFNIWYKNDVAAGNYHSLYYNTGCEEQWIHFEVFHDNRDDEWHYKNFSLSELSSNNNIRFRIRFKGDSYQPEGIMIDDVYIGEIKPDLSIERNDHNLFSASNSAQGEIKYYLNNSGLFIAEESTTSFYWSTDPILDAEDVFLGNKTEAALADTSFEWRSFSFTKPTQAIGKYYIIYTLDVDETIDEMRESNNTDFITIYQNEIVTFPYENDFEEEVDGWRHNTYLGTIDWEWGNPNVNGLDSVLSGVKSWRINFDDSVSEDSRALLYTPVFDLSSAVNPVLEFNMLLSDYNNSTINGDLNMSYSVDGGATWHLLDTTNYSFKRWYYYKEYHAGKDNFDYMPSSTEWLFEDYEKTFMSYQHYNGRDVPNNYNYILDLAFLNSEEQIQFRYNFANRENPFEPGSLQMDGVVLDDFKIAEAFVDLIVDYKKALMLSANANKLKFEMQIRNQGNYLCDSTLVKYYLSENNSLDESDYFLGQKQLSWVQPDMMTHVNGQFDSPENLSDYKYLIYELDALQAINESNELNNTSFWNLALDSISTLPYENNFNDSVIDGWYSHSILSFNGNSYESYYRFRNMKVQAEYPRNRDNQSGEYFSDSPLAGSYQYDPTIYLETPAFNFESYDSLFLSFDLVCSGKPSYSDKDGGNMWFSEDGGNTWAILDIEFGEAENWYNVDDLDGMDNEPGWAENIPWDTVGTFKTRTFNLSFLKGKKDIVFRYKHKSNWSSNGSIKSVGLRLDNFLIEGYTIDLEANTSTEPIIADINEANISINYSISNNGESVASNSKTRFFWSTDSIFDLEDQLMQTVNHSSIAPQETFNSSTSFNYPQTITQENYFVFILADSDSILIESDETNNLTYAEVYFQPFVNFVSLDIEDTLFVETAIDSFYVNYSFLNNGIMDASTSITNFYWSEDDILDDLDPMIQTKEENEIAINDTLLADDFIHYPGSIIQEFYHLFYEIDGDNQFSEYLEDDNTGHFVVVFDSIPSPEYNTFITLDSVFLEPFVESFDISYSITNNGVLDGINSTTSIYWSENEDLNIDDDLLIYEFIQEGVMVDSTVLTELTLEYPLPVTQLIYYLFIQLDQENFLQFEEDNYKFNMDEDNLERVVVVFDYIPTSNYSTQEYNDTLSALTSVPSFNFPYSIINDGSLDGIPSSTGFYWSENSDFTTEDLNFQNELEDLIHIDDTLNLTVDITYPTPITQEFYYLYYKIDNEDVISEIYEDDNIGYRVIQFDYATSIEEQNNIEIYIYANENKLFINITNASTNQIYKISMLDTKGDIVYELSKDLNEGRNVVELPSRISDGLYIIQISNNELNYAKKISIFK